jgi:hypothetical protein
MDVECRVVLGNDSWLRMIAIFAGRWHNRNPRC